MTQQEAEEMLDDLYLTSPKIAETTEIALILAMALGFYLREGEA